MENRVINRGWRQKKTIEASAARELFKTFNYSEMFHSDWTRQVDPDSIFTWVKLCRLAIEATNKAKEKKCKEEEEKNKNNIEGWKVSKLLLLLCFFC